MEPDTITKSGFDIYYVGGVAIGSTDDNSIDINGVTVSATDSGLPSDVAWTCDFNLFAFEGCSMVYEGVTTQGYTCDYANPGYDPLGYDSSACCVDFQCPGDL